jgi:3-oxoacyl-[acyl-carrier protein] reductase
MNTRPLDGRVALVTGAGRGLGREFARWLAAAGAHVVACARTQSDLDALAEELGPEAMTEPCDVADAASVHALVERALARFGRVDIAIANAAILGPVGGIDAVEPAAWAQTLQVNVAGTAAVARAVIPHMRRAGFGRIVTMSGAGAGGPNLPDRVSAYVASKGAVMLLTEVLAKELPAGVTVNSIAPGAVPTGFMQEVVDKGRGTAGDALFDSVRQQLDAGMPDLEPLRALLLYVVSDEAEWCTGRCLSARWDPPDSLRAAVASELVDGDRWRLRRIDEDLYGTRRGPA